MSHKITQSARFELAREDPIWFRVRRLNHSAMTACGLLDSYQSLLMFSVFYPVDLDGQNNTQKSMLISICFLVVQDEPKKTQSARSNLLAGRSHLISVRRLNHSAMTACGLLDSSKSMLIFSICCFFPVVQDEHKLRSQQDSNLRGKIPSDF